MKSHPPSPTQDQTGEADYVRCFVGPIHIPIEGDSAPVSSRLELALDLVLRGDTGELLRKLEALSPSSTDQPVLLARYGTTLLIDHMLGGDSSVPTAEDYLQRATALLLDSPPDDRDEAAVALHRERLAGIHNNMAVAARANGSPQASLEHLERAMRALPSLSAIWVNLLLLAVEEEPLISVDTVLRRLKFQHPTFFYADQTLRDALAIDSELAPFRQSPQYAALRPYMLPVSSTDPNELRTARVVLF